MMKPRRKNNPDKQERPEDEAMTMVIHLGEVGASVKELSEDLKVVLAPYTFAKLKVQRKNKLRDFIREGPPLGAKMLMVLRCSLDQTTLEMTKFPRGPTLYFNVERFATIKDVHHNCEDTATFNKTTRTEPVLVLDGFTKSDEDEVIVSMLQGLFPEIKFGAENMKFMKRVVIASKGEDGVISLRHFRIKKNDLLINQGIKDIVDGKVDLSSSESYDDYILQKVTSKKDKKQRCSIRLQEIGPRIDMTFKQVETGVFGGMRITEDNEDKPKPDKKFRYMGPSEREEHQKRPRKHSM